MSDQKTMDYLYDMIRRTSREKMRLAIALIEIKSGLHDLAECQKVASEAIENMDETED
jgi:hypothetical protein